MKTSSRLAALTTASLVAGAVLATPAALAAPVEPIVGSQLRNAGTAEFGEAVSMGSYLLFLGGTDTHGEELWRTDGTPANTDLVKDITPGEDGSVPREMTAAGGFAYFAANDPTGGRELWRSNGTTGGTTRVSDIRPGAQGSTPRDLTALGSSIVFVADSGQGEGTELWVSDGTDAGTELLKDINPGADSSSPTNLRTIGGVVYFSAFDDTDGRELWKTDGTPGGTVQVADINAGGAGSSPNHMTLVDGKVVFAAQGGAGRELYRTEGTPATTALVKDVFPGGFGNPDEITRVGGTAYFVGTDSSGKELWKTDGTGAGTVKVRDIRPGADGSNPARLTTLGNRLLFRATAAGDNLEPWISDGTPAGTKTLSEIRPGAAGSSVDGFFAHGSTAIFAANDGVHGRELWATTPNSTSLVQDLVEGAADSEPAAMGHVGTATVFRIFVGNEVQLWALQTQDVAVVQAGTPTVSGKPAVGKVLTASLGAGWEPLGGTSFRWFRNGVAVPGATASTYAVTKADLGAALTVRVRGFKDGEINSYRFSAPVEVQLGTQSLQPTPKVKGIAKVGRTLTAKPGEHDKGVTLSYRWLRDGKPIANATAKKYVVKKADRGDRLSVRVKATKAGYATVVKKSAKTAKVV